MEHRPGRAGIAEPHADVRARHLGVRLQGVGQGARGPGAGGLHRSVRRGGCRRLAVPLDLPDPRRRRLRRGQRRAQRRVVGRLEVEHRGQVAADSASPGGDVRLHHAEPRLQEADHRGVVEHLRIDEPAPRPGRDRIHRHAGTQAVGPTDQAGTLPQQLARRLDQVVLARGVHGRAAQQVFAVPGGRSRRRHVVEEAVVLVEHHQKNRAAPDLRVGGQGLDDPGGVVRPLGRAGGARVLGVRLGRDHVGHLRQGPGEHIGPQPVQRPGA